MNLSELIVTDRRALERGCSALAGAGRFGFDTEFIRERSYVPQVCLIQAAGGGSVVLIDPLAVDPAPFWELVLDPAVEKIGHACEQDLEMCYRHTGRPPACIFDVQVAAGLAGVGYSLGYAELARLALGVEVVGDATATDWSRRPLSDGQLRYAVEDVAYLVDLEAFLRGRLAELGREDWMREEMAPLERAEEYAPQPIDAVRRIRGWDRLSRRRLGVLCELVAWREQAARADDCPPRTLVQDAVLRAVAAAMPATVPALAAVRGFPRPLARRHGREALAALRRGALLPHADLPQAAAREIDRGLVTRAMEAGREICLAAGIDHRVLGSRRNYIDLVEALRANPADPGDQRLLTGWRRGFAGERLRRLILQRLRRETV